MGEFRVFVMIIAWWSGMCFAPEDGFPVLKAGVAWAFLTVGMMWEEAKDVG